MRVPCGKTLSEKRFWQFRRESRLTSINLKNFSHTIGMIGDGKAGNTVFLHLSEELLAVREISMHF
jgi:hypothetical protein